VNDPPTAVGGIQATSFDVVCRQDLNDPPTAVGGIQATSFDVVCRLDLNHPPTAVGGIRAIVRFSVLSAASSVRRAALREIRHV
jgi:hypothetical protein